MVELIFPLRLSKRARNITTHRFCARKIIKNLACQNNGCTENLDLNRHNLLNTNAPATVTVAKMKTTIKIIACGIWFGFILWLSIYCDRFYFDFLNLIKKKIIHAEIPPEIDFAITIIPWNCFISLLICLPILFVKKQRANAMNKIGLIIVFFFMLLSCNLFGILIWSVYFPESIGSYSGAPSFSVIEPYAINEGWTPFQFWCAWWGFIIASNAISVGMAFAIQFAGKSNPAIRSNQIWKFIFGR